MEHISYMQGIFVKILCDCEKVFETGLTTEEISTGQTKVICPNCNKETFLDEEYKPID